MFIKNAIKRASWWLKRCFHKEAVLHCATSDWPWYKCWSSFIVKVLCHDKIETFIRKVQRRLKCGWKCYFFGSFAKFTGCCFFISYQFCFKQQKYVNSLDVFHACWWDAVSCIVTRRANTYDCRVTDPNFMTLMHFWCLQIWCSMVFAQTSYHNRCWTQRHSSSCLYHWFMVNASM